MTFFIVKHEFKGDKAAAAAEWFAKMAPIISDEAAMAKMKEEQASLGFFNHWFAPAPDSATTGAPMHCLWETTKSKEEMETFIRSSDKSPTVDLENTVFEAAADFGVKPHFN
mmetsp:Transcript_10645/g.32806  ORF Transcript_10645/g.32806 Transcript_10645/m.32806 type:complete len:112 (+) Transcript_10645:66-401(+)